MKRNKRYTLIAVILLVLGLIAVGIWHKHKTESQTNAKCHSTTVIGVDYIYPACPGAKVIRMQGQQ